MKYFENLPDLPTTHTELVDFILLYPKILGPDFIPIQKGFAIQRGIVDIFGKKNGRFCLVEVKVDTSRSSGPTAKRQLLSYAGAFNSFLTLIESKKVDFCFIFARYVGNGTLEVRSFENEDALCTFRLKSPSHARVPKKDKPLRFPRRQYKHAY